MSGRTLAGLVVALLACMGLGIGFGEWYYRLFENAIPEALKAQTNMQGTHIMFILRGVVIGAILFVWTLLATLTARLFTRRRPSEPTTP